MSRLLRLGAALLLAASATAQETNPNFEVDIVFPRNETYTASDAFPFAMAIQNITAVRSLGDWVVNWAVMVLQDGSVNRGGLQYHGVMGDNRVVDMGDHALLVGYTNITEWTFGREPGDAYELQWNLDWPDVYHACDWYGAPVGGEIVFSVEAPMEQDRSVQGIEPDVASAGECPVLSTVVEIRPNPANETCPDILNNEENGIEGTPCEIVVDDEVAEKVMNEVERLIELNRGPEEPDPSEEEDAAGSLVPPVGATLAAACALGYLAFTHG